MDSKKWNVVSIASNVLSQTDILLNGTNFQVSDLYIQERMDSLEKRTQRDGQNI
jgi:hypothetical protein